MFTSTFWKAAGERAIKTFAQSFVAAVPVTAITLGSVDWLIVASTAALATLLSVFTAIGLPPSEVKLTAEIESYVAQHNAKKE